MAEFSTDRRTLIRGLGALGVGSMLSSPASAQPQPPETTPNTRATYRAVVDSVVPRTPELESELGPEHVPGGLSVGLDEYLVTFINELFSFGVPTVGEAGNMRLAEAVAVVLDVGAAKLVATGENDEPPSVDRVVELLEPTDLLELDRLTDDPESVLEQSLFAALSREDRLRAIAGLDSIEFDTAEFPGPLTEADAALVGQLVVGFTEVVYYSEWQGYEDITAPPSERAFSPDVDSWDQTDFPGVIDGAAALRGYWGAPNSSLGAGGVWDTAVTGRGPPKQLYGSPGSFEDSDDYDTSGYEEPFSTDGEPAADGPLGDAVSSLNGDVTDSDVADGDLTDADSATDGDISDPADIAVDGVFGSLLGVGN
ncbi:MAG: hypothetical protein ACOCQM_07085 [Natronomonas sp.]